jgi:hypothetical protein
MIDFDPQDVQKQKEFEDKYSHTVQLSTHDLEC